MSTMTLIDAMNVNGIKATDPDFLEIFEGFMIFVHGWKSENPCTQVLFDAYWKALTPEGKPLKTWRDIGTTGFKFPRG